MTDLTLDDIRAISDAAEVAEAIDALRLDCAQIESQLEFRSDDEADEEWERRAIGALAHHKRLLGEALRIERRLSGKSVGMQKADAEARLLKETRRIRAQEVQQTAAAEKKARELARQNDIRDRALRLAENVAGDAAFRRAALRLLTDDQYRKIEAAANRQVSGAVKELIG